MPSVLRHPNDFYPLCISNPLAMTNNQATARQIMIKNWNKYLGVMKSNLSWRPVSSNGVSNLDDNGVPHQFQLNGNVLTVHLGPNEMIIFQPK